LQFIKWDKDGAVEQEIIESNIRNMLIHDRYNDWFGYHLNGIVIANLIEVIFNSSILLIKQEPLCNRGNEWIYESLKETPCFDIIPRTNKDINHASNNNRTIELLIQETLQMRWIWQCRTCRGTMELISSNFITPLSIILLDVQECRDVIIPRNIKLPVQNNTNCTVKLSGMIYQGNNHFTTRIISESNKIFYNDSITTQRRCIYEGMFEDC